MKTWLIVAYCPYASETYMAYADENPEEELEEDGTFGSLLEDLWEGYNYIEFDNLENDLEDDEEISDEEYNEIYENWMANSRVDVKEATLDEITEHAPDGNLDYVEIIYDERKQ